MTIIQQIENFQVIISLNKNLGFINIMDGALYSDNDSRSKRYELGHNSILIPAMKREELEKLRDNLNKILDND